jgi:hypothetical protein
VIEGPTTKRILPNFAAAAPESITSFAESSTNCFERDPFFPYGKNDVKYLAVELVVAVEKAA